MSDSDEDFASADEGDGLSHDTKSKSVTDKTVDVKTKKQPDSATKKPTTAKKEKEDEQKKPVGGRKVPPKKTQVKNPVSKPKTVDVKSDERVGKTTGKGKKSDTPAKGQSLKLSTKEKDSSSTSTETRKQMEDTTGSPVRDDSVLPTAGQETVDSAKRDDESDMLVTQTSDSHTTAGTGDSNKTSKEQTESQKSGEVTPQTSGEVNLQTSGEVTQQSTEEISTKENTNVEKKEASSGWSAWGSWGSSLMNVATQSVTTFTSQVEEGFNTLVDAVETSMGAMTPEELAEMKKKAKQESEAPGNTSIDRETSDEENKSEKDKSSAEGECDKGDNSEMSVEGADMPPDKTPNKNLDKEGAEGGWFSSWGMPSLATVVQNTTTIVQNTTNMVQSTSKNIVTGSIDVLETIGKKTFDVIKDHDPGLRKTKEVLFQRGDKPNLSRILRDAKEDAAKRVEMEKESDEARKAHFGFMFDEYQGLAHLEALEMLSNQCEKKVQTLLVSMPEETLVAIKSDLIRIKQVFERDEEDSEEEEPEDQDFTKLVMDNLTELRLGVKPDKLNKSQTEIRQKIAEFRTKLESDEKPLAKDVHQVAIQSLAELTSKSVEQFHKAGELILLQRDSDKQFTKCATSLSDLTNVLCTEVGILSVKFTGCLNTIADEDSGRVNTLVTNIYLEAGNSSTYIQDAFQLLLPCLQEVTIQAALQQDN